MRSCHRNRLLAATLLGLIGLSGCSKPVAAVRPAVFTRHSIPQAGLTPAEQALVDKNCYKGMPKLNPDFQPGPSHLIIRDGYVLRHSTLSKIPFWVCEGVRQSQLAGSVPRRNSFNPDPKLPVGQRAELSDYKGSGYDRGHMAPAGNQTVSRELKAETFFLSNMAPQKGVMNQQIWAALEEQSRKWVNTRQTVFQVTGGFFYDPAEDNTATADGIINFFEIGGNHVAVPTHFFKVLIAKDSTGKDEAVAFVMENRGYPRPFNFGEHIKPIRWIEERAGIDFFPDLDPGESLRLERNANPIWQ